ncbi:MAG: amino acid permease [Burkholderiales bacterium]|nr:amino acid permease [Burkholderiales bacterium]
MKNKKQAIRNLRTSLKQRHLSMMSIGGVIGAGYFLGVGQAVIMAGPAVILSYLFGGIVTMLVMILLAEMSVAMPLAGSFHLYAEISFGKLVGFITGWTYWLAFLIGPASETIAAGTFLHLWFPSISVGYFCLIVATLLSLINIIGAKFFGEVEFWLSLIKVIALLIFIGSGIYTLGFHLNPNISFKNYTIHGGFLPYGYSGVLSAMMIVFFSYGGTESIATAAEECVNPRKIIPRALIGTVLRIFLLFILSIIVLLAVLPWNNDSIHASPYVVAFGILNGNVAANIMNFVVLTAALSCIDTGIFATSRMLLSLAQQNYFPKIFSYINPKTQTPIVAILLSCIMLYVGVILSFLTPNAFTILGSLSGFGFLFTWLIIALSQPRFRKYILQTQPQSLTFKVKLTPYIQYLTVALMLAILCGQFFVTNGWITITSGIIWILIASIYYLIRVKHFMIRKD